MPASGDVRTTQSGQQPGVSGLRTAVAPSVTAPTVAMPMPQELPKVTALGLSNEATLNDAGVGATGQLLPPRPPSEGRPPAPSNVPGPSKRPPPLRRSTAPGTVSRAPSKPPLGGSAGSISEALAAASSRVTTTTSEPPAPEAPPTVSPPASEEPVASTAPTSPSASPAPFPALALPDPPAIDAPSSSDEIDQRFANIVSQPPRLPEQLLPQELDEAQKLFLEISSTYLGPVRDLVMEIELGEPTKDWLAICRPAVASLKRAADEMELNNLAAGLANLLGNIEQAERAPGQLIDPRAREALRASYLTLVSELPQVFAIQQERDRREPIIVQSLLLQVSEVRKVALDRLYAAGLTSLDMFFKAKPSDIADAAGVPRELAERIVARFQRYRRELSAAPPSPKRTREKSQLEALTRKLEEQNRAFDTSSRGFAGGEEKRRLRQERSATVLELNLLLARLGEVALIEQLERLPFHKKVDELKQYLAGNNG